MTEEERAERQEQELKEFFKEKRSERKRAEEQRRLAQIRPKVTELKTVDGVFSVETWKKRDENGTNL